MKIGIIGNGYVGKATRLLENPEVTCLCYDINPLLCDPIGLCLEDVAKADIIFVCVPTPMGVLGDVHLDIVRTVVADLQKYTTDENFIVIRSTVPPGVSDELKTYFMPEFLTEKNFINDFKNNQHRIVGINTSHTNNDLFKNKMQKLISSAHHHGMIAFSHIEWTTNREAEMAKYFRNTFLATKVSFCNEMYEYCQKTGIDYNEMARVACLDPRIGAHHTAVPGPDGRRGFGGTCFPKDVHGMIYEMGVVGMTSHVLTAVQTRNETVDRPDKDWSKDVGRAVVS